MQRSFLATAGGALALNMGAGQAWAQGPGNTPVNPQVTPGAKGSLPKGKILKLEMSRLILGGNLLIGGMHAHGMPVLSRLPTHYNTMEKKLETMALAEANGIDTIGIHTHPGITDMLRKYKKERGGKMKVLASPVAKIVPDLKAYFDEVRRLVEDGEVEAIYIWGERAEQMLAAGRMAELVKMVEFAKELDVPSGVGAHDLNVIKLCEKNKVPVDFYVKTLHHHTYPTAPRPEQIKGPYSEANPSYWCSDPEGTIEYMKTVAKPWIAFKVMACGAIPPQDAISYAFNSGADFVWAGMFDFDIEDDCKITRDAVAKSQSRPRAWHA